MQTKLTNQTFYGADNRESLYDLEIPKNWNQQILIFIHGYMGFKDWGCWNLMQDFFARQGFAFVKYNVSHNGCTVDSPTDFVDLNAFAENNYWKEITDFEAIITLIQQKFPKGKISVIGHSRGGGIALLQSQHPFVQQIISLAGIASIEERFPQGENLEKWKNDGFYLRKNGRTNQQMPHNFSQYQSFLEHKDRLNIEKFCRLNSKPTLVIHGEKDTSVLPIEGKEIASWLGTNLISIPNTNHTFNSSEPWKKSTLPTEMKLVCEIIHGFLLQNTKENAEEEKRSILSDLVKMAKSDNSLREEEFSFLFQLARQIGVSQEDFKQIFEQHIDFKPPRLEVDRIVQFQRLVLMMNVDGKIEQEEMDYIQNIGIKMGLNTSATKEILRIMNHYPNGAIPPDKMIEIFKTFLN